MEFRRVLFRSLARERVKDMASDYEPALTTVVADRFAPNERGTASGFVGAGMTSGLTVGTIVAGLLAGTIVYAYWLFAVAIVVVCLAFVLINRERSEEHTSELQSLMRSSYAVFCLKKKNQRL